MTIEDVEKEDSGQLSAGDLILSFVLSQLLLLIPGVLLLWYFYLDRGYTLLSFYSLDNMWGILIGGTLTALCGVVLQWFAWKRFGYEAFDDGGINRLLLTLPMKSLLPLFVIGAFSEELLLRGALQTGMTNSLGYPASLLITSLIFTVLHLRYRKKPVLICGVFLLSLILGSLYGISGTLWAPVLSHFLYNASAAWLAKKYVLPEVDGQSI